MLPLYASVNLQPRGHCSTLIFLPGRNLWARRVSVWQARAEGGVPEVGAFTKWSLLNLPSLYWAEGYHRRLSHHIMSYHIVSYHVVSFMLIRSGLHSNWKRTLKFTQESMSYMIWDLTWFDCRALCQTRPSWGGVGAGGLVSSVAKPWIFPPLQRQYVSGELYHLIPLWCHYAMGYFMHYYAPFILQFAFLAKSRECACQQPTCCHHDRHAPLAVNQPQP